jgi:hypothetical protein
MAASSTSLTGCVACAAREQDGSNLSVLDAFEDQLVWIQKCPLLCPDPFYVGCYLLVASTTTTTTGEWRESVPISAKTRLNCELRTVLEI